VIRLGGTCELIDRGVVPPTQAGRRTPRSIRTSAGQRWRCAVAFTSSAAQELRDEVAEFDGYEIGGGLFGSVADDGTVIVERVCGPSYWMERSTNEIVIEPDRYRAIEETLPWVGAGVGTGTSTIPCRRSRAMLTSAAGRPSFGVRSASMRG
jgi:hypothetical protein